MTDKDKKRGRPLTHGFYSVNVAKKFDDRRTIKGRELAESITGLVNHFGGSENITAPMQLLLDSNIRPKLIVLMSMSEFINNQKSLINDAGELLPILGANYLAFSNALRRDLESLAIMAKDAGKEVKPLSISELIK